MPAIIAYLTSALQLVPLLISTGQDIGAFAQQVYGVITQSGPPTEAQWLALHQKEDALRTQLQQPLPGGTTITALAASGVGVSIPTAPAAAS